MNRDNWRSFLIEGVVIIASILIAFGIDAWWDGQSEPAEERGALERLSEEFAANKDRLIDVREQKAKSRSDALALLRLFATQGDPPGTFGIPDSLLSSIGSTREFVPVSGALSSLLSSGGLAIIADDTPRTRLAAWPDLLYQLAERERRERDTSFGVIVPLLHSHVPYTTLDYRAGVDGVRGPSPFPDDYEGLLRSLEAENWVEMRQYGLRSRLLQYDDLIDEAGFIQSRIIKLLGN